MPDATGLELLARELRRRPGQRLDTVFFRDRRRSTSPPEAIRAMLAFPARQGLHVPGLVHGLDYYPEEPRLGVQYELLDMNAVDRITVKLRVPTDDPRVDSVTPDWPTADHQEREVYDMFGVVFDGHRTCAGS